jgi:hypothetical protein
MSLRTYGRTFDVYGNATWQVITTAPNGDDSLVYLTTLIQNLLLILGESPFYADHGIPAQQSVLTQIAPDFYVSRIQSQFAKYFASLIISRTPQVQKTAQVPPPTYTVNVITLQGAVLPSITVPTSIPI